MNWRDTKCLQEINYPTRSRAARQGGSRGLRLTGAVLPCVGAVCAGGAVRPPSAPRGWRADLSTCSAISPAPTRRESFPSMTLLAEVAEATACACSSPGRLSGAAPVQSFGRKRLSAASTGPRRPEPGAVRRWFQSVARTLTHAVGQPGPCVRTRPDRAGKGQWRIAEHLRRSIFSDVAGDLATSVASDLYSAGRTHLHACHEPRHRRRAARAARAAYTARSTHQWTRQY